MPGICRSSTASVVRAPPPARGVQHGHRRAAVLGPRLRDAREQVPSTTARFVALSSTTSTRQALRQRSPGRGGAAAPDSPRCKPHGEAERAAGAQPAATAELAAHQLDQLREMASPSPVPAEAPGGGRVGLGERLEQPLECAGAMPIPVSGTSNVSIDRVRRRSSARGPTRTTSPAVGELDRVARAG